MAHHLSLRAVLFDRDGTLIRDVPYNNEPKLVEPLPMAGLAVDLVRRRGLRTGVVTNQSGVGRGLITSADVARVNARVDALLGPFDVWEVCEHGPHDGCLCRKPEPGLIMLAAAELGVPCAQLVVIGDIGADVEAARAAGAGAVLVPTPVTLPDEIASAPVVAYHLLDAVRRALRGEATV